MNAQRDLLLAVLALQARRVDSAMFAGACSAWLQDPSVPLGSVLEAHGLLRPQDRTALENMAERTLNRVAEDMQSVLGEREDAQDIADDSGSTVLPGSVAGLVLPPAAQQTPQSDRAKKLFEGQKPVAKNITQRYQKLRIHAAGGIGQVWLALDQDLDREVALKELRNETADDPDMRRRFLAEAKITGQLEHPGIVPVYELAATDLGQEYYVMRFVKGRTLSEAIGSYHQKKIRGEASSLDLSTLLNAFVAVCNAVAYAHARNIVHRDLKGQNVLLGDFGEIIVLDWGLAKKLGENEPAAVAGDKPAKDSAATDSTIPPSFDLTQPGEVLGTPAYMAPEQAEARPDLIGPATDIYALGAILYEILSGRTPFTFRPSPGMDRKEQVTEILRKIREVPPDPPRQFVHDVPKALEAVCLKSLAKKPGDRYASAADLAQEVRRWLADEPVRAFAEPWHTRFGRWARRHRTMVASIGVLLVAAVVALGISTLLISREQARTQEARDQALTHFRTARTAVDRYFVQVSEEDSLKREPALQSFRGKLLEVARQYYQDFIKEHGSDAELQEDLGGALLKLARVHSELDEYPKALKVLDHAIGVAESLALEKSDRERRYLLAQCYLARGVAFHKLKDQNDQAEAAYLRARDILKEVLQQSSDADAETRLAFCVANLGVVWGQRKDQFPKAQAAHAEALEIYERLSKAHPEKHELKDNLAGGHSNMASFLYRYDDKGQFSNLVEKHLFQALALHQELATMHQNPYQNHLAKTHNHLALFYGVEQDTKAQHHFDQALKLRQELAEAMTPYPSDQADLYYNRGFFFYRLQQKALGNHSFATLPKADKKLFLEETARANQDLQKALPLFRRLTKAHPENSSFQAMLGLALYFLGNVAFDHDVSSALLWYDQATPVLRELLPRHYEKEKVIRDALANIFWGKAEIHGKAKQFAASLDSWKQALELDPQNADFMKASLRTLDQAAVAGYFQDAAAWKSVEAFRSVPAFWEMPEFKAWRDRLSPKR